MSDQPDQPAEAPAGDTWPSRVEVAVALGVPRQRLASWARRGCPLPAGPIPCLPVYAWAWKNARDLPADASIDATKKREEVRKLQLANQAKSRSHLEEASSAAVFLVGRVKNRLRAEMSGAALHDLHKASQGPLAVVAPLMTQALLARLDRAIAEALAVEAAS